MTVTQDVLLAYYFNALPIATLAFEWNFTDRIKGCAIKPG
jgi:hypothetical protein